MDILTILAGVIIVFSVGKNVVFSKNNSRKRNRQIITISAALTIVFNIVSYIIYKKSINFFNIFSSIYCEKLVNLF